MLAKLRGNPMVVLLSLCLGVFMVLLDATIVNVAIPSIVNGLHATLDEVLWVVNAYIIVFAVLLITSGRLGDILGPRTLFLAGMALFAIASALCGIVGSAGGLIAARALQGVGAAMLTPQVLALITVTFPPQRRGMAFGIFGAVNGIAAVAGPTLGGLIVTAFGWPWIFFVNVPVGAVAFVLALLLVPDLRPGRRHRLDVAGVLLASAGLLAIVYGLIDGQRHGWGTVFAFVTIPEIIGVGVLLLAIFLVYQHQRRELEPLVPLALFRDRNYALMCLVGFLFLMAFVGLLLPLTIYLQTVLGLSPAQAGITVVAMPLAGAIAAPIGGRLTDRIGGKYVLIGGLGLFAIGMALFDLAARLDSNPLVLVPCLFLAGAGPGAVAALTTVAMGGVPRQLAGSAAGVLQTAQRLGSVFGNAIVGAILQARLVASLHDAAVTYGAQLPDGYRATFVDSIGRAATNGVPIGAVAAPAGFPPGSADLVRQVAHSVFTHAFVDAMRPALLFPIAIAVIATASCFAIRTRQPGGEGVVRKPGSEAAA